MVGRQTPFLAVIVPLILIGMVDGRRGIRQTWPAAVVGGVAFAVGQFLCVGEGEHGGDRERRPLELVERLAVDAQDEHGQQP